MELNQKLFDCIAESAAAVQVTQVCIGLGYTAVTTSDGGIGIAATGISLSNCMSGNFDIPDYEDQPAMALLPSILVSLAVKGGGSLASRSVWMDQYSSDWNA